MRQPYYKFTRVRTKFNHVGFMLRQPWAAWAERFCEHELTDAPKDEREGFVPGPAPCRGVMCRFAHAKDTEFVGDAYTTDVHVAQLEALVLDIDGYEPGDKRGHTRAQINEVLSRMQGATCSVYTTSTKPIDPNEHRVRIVVPLSRPVPSKEWPAFWNAAVYAVGTGHVDTSCKNRSRYFILPFKQADETHHWAERHEGHLFGVDGILARYAREVPERARSAAATVAALDTGSRKDITARSMQDAIAALPDLQDGRWNTVRTIGFALGKLAAFKSQGDPSITLAATLEWAAKLFAAALSRCELSERNPHAKLLQTAHDCISNGWSIRMEEISVVVASLPKPRKRNTDD